VTRRTIGPARSPGPDRSGNPPPNDNLQRDSNGNAIGGIRSPHLDVPIATLIGEAGNPGPSFCSSFGATIPFDSAKLASLYNSHGAFVSKWSASVAAMADAGFITPEDAELVQASAAQSSIRRKS
jgi:hypothetical protein